MYRLYSFYLTCLSSFTAPVTVNDIFVSRSLLPSGVSQRWVMDLPKLCFKLALPQNIYFNLIFIFKPLSRVFPRCLPMTTASGQWMNLKKISLQVSMMSLCFMAHSFFLVSWNMPTWWVTPLNWYSYRVLPHILNYLWNWRHEGLRADKNNILLATNI